MKKKRQSNLSGTLFGLGLLVVLFGLVFGAAGGTLFDFSAHANVSDGDGDAIAISGLFGSARTNQETTTTTWVDETELSNSVQVRSEAGIFLFLPTLVVLFLVSLVTIKRVEI